MNTVIFARGYNIQGQIEYCREYAEKKGYKVECVIVGQGRDLPSVILGLGFKVDRVIVRDMARISRNALEGYTIQADLELESGAIIEIATEQPRDEAFERFMRNVIMAVREDEAKERERQIREKLIMRGIMDI